MTSKTRQIYVMPQIKTLQAITENLLQTGSGQNKHIGQGGQYGEAKHQDFYWVTWDNDVENTGAEECIEK